MLPPVIISIYFLSSYLINIDAMIITSVFAGPKKYKTVTFDLFPFPLSYSVPNKKQFSYRGHYTFKRPNFNVDMSMPVTIPLNFDHVDPNVQFNQDADQNSDAYSSTSYQDADQHQSSYQEDNQEENNNHSYEDANSNNNNEYGDAHESTSHSDEEYVTDNNQYDANNPPPSREKLPAYILNGENDIKSSSDVSVQTPDTPNNVNKYAGYESPASADSPRPYTGKAQVSSFIDNGQFVTAHQPVMSKTPVGVPITAHRVTEQFDTNYSDERSSDAKSNSDANRRISSPRRSSTMSNIDRMSSFGFGVGRSGLALPSLSIGTFPTAISFPIAEKIYAAKKSKGKTISLGYNTKSEEPTNHPITLHARNPDALPYNMNDYSDIQKYYTTFQFTDQFRGPLIESPWTRKKRFLTHGFINLG